MKNVGTLSSSGIKEVPIFSVCRVTLVLTNAFQNTGTNGSLTSSSSSQPAMTCPVQSLFSALYGASPAGEEKKGLKLHSIFIISLFATLFT